jgi:hypothetical protein
MFFCLTRQRWKETNLSRRNFPRSGFQWGRLAELDIPVDSVAGFSGPWGFTGPGSRLWGNWRYLSNRGARAGIGIFLFRKFSQ